MHSKKCIGWRSIVGIMCYSWGKSLLKIPFDELAFSTIALEQRTGEKLYSHARRLVKIEGNM